MCEITRICARLPRRNARRQDRHHQSVAIADVPHIELAMPLVHHPVHAGKPGLYDEAQRLRDWPLDLPFDH
jgi:hypothetical protein